MKKTALMFTISVFALITLFITVSIADDQKGVITVSPNIGGYFFEGNQELEDGITSGINLGYNFNKTCSVEGSFNYINSERKDIDGYVRGYLYKFDYLYSITNYGKLVPYVAAGFGGITLNPKYGGASNDFLFDYGAGLKYFITDDIALRGDVRHVLPYGSIGKDNSQNNLLCTIGLSCLFGVEKEKPKIETVSEVKETPPVAEDIDTDGDGVYDSLDKCPDTPKDVKVDSDGCPLDTDGDGVYDYLDKCPDTPKGVKVDADGCPLDTDGDGVYDYIDECPGTPKGATVDCRGCWVLEGVYFNTAKWNIVSQYFPILDNVVGIIKKNPAMKLEIQGHTDNRGTAKYNQKLSENRAKAVLEYFVGKGIDRSSLTAKGFGFSVPAAPNDTKDGMAKNRRVELKPIY